MEQKTNVRVQSQRGWVAAPGTAGISQRVTSDASEQRMTGADLKVLVPIATMGCEQNEY